MYRLGTFKSLSGFKGGGVILMTSILMFHLINRDTRSISIRGNHEWRL
jgi:hypothetical protein